jgi:hypothetical protein
MRRGTQERLAQEKARPRIICHDDDGQRCRHDRIPHPTVNPASDDRPFMKGIRQTVELSRATQLMNHGPETIITSAHGERSNIMAASWAMPLDFSPPKVVAYADSRVYSNNRWHFGDDPDVRTCHYVAGGTFFATGEAFEVDPVPVRSGF